MKLSLFLFFNIFQDSASHIVKRNAAPIRGDNLCIIECTGVTGDWVNYANTGIKVDGNYYLFDKKGI